MDLCCSVALPCAASAEPRIRSCSGAEGAGLQRCQGCEGGRVSAGRGVVFGSSCLRRGGRGGKALAPPRGSGLLCPQHRLPGPGPCLPALVLSVKDARPSSPARLPWFVRTLDQSKDKNWTRRGLRPSLNVQTARNLAGLIKYLSSSTRRTKKKTKNKTKKNNKTPTKFSGVGAIRPFWLVPWWQTRRETRKS